MLSDSFIEALFNFFGETSRTIFEIQHGVRPEGLSPLQYNILEYVYFKHQTTISEISKCHYLSMPNASREVRKLIEKGMLRKTTDSRDRRSQLISLDEAGEFLMTQVVGKMIEVANKRYKKIDADKEEDILRAMRLLGDHLFFETDEGEA